MNELMNKVTQFRSEVDHVWKMPNTLDCLRYAAKSANELRHLWMRQQDFNCDRHNDMTQELANTVIVLLTAAKVSAASSGVGIGEGGYIQAKKHFDSLCFYIEHCAFLELTGSHCHLCELSIHYDLDWDHHLFTAIKCCRIAADDLGVTLDDIVKARLKDIAKRNGFDPSLVDEVWLKAEMLKVSDDHKPHRHYDD